MKAAEVVAWAIDFVDNLANLKFQNIVEDVRTVRTPFEEDIFNNQQSVEDEALKLYKVNPKLAQDYLTNYSNGLMKDVTEMFLELRNQIIVNYTNNLE